MKWWDRRSAGLSVVSPTDKVRSWSQSRNDTWLYSRARGPPEVAHHRPTFSTSALAWLAYRRRITLLRMSLPCRWSVSLTGQPKTRMSTWYRNGNYWLYGPTGWQFSRTIPASWSYENEITGLLWLAIVISGYAKCLKATFLTSRCLEPFKIFLMLRASLNLPRKFGPSSRKGSENFLLKQIAFSAFFLKPKFLGQFIMVHGKHAIDNGC